MTTDYERVIDAIIERVRTGEYQPGQRLPSIARLAEEFEVSPGTIKNAQMILRDRGITRGHPGKGVFIVEHPPIG